MPARTPRIGLPPDLRVNRMRVKVVLEPSDDGGYTVYVPALPGCISEGSTRQDAPRNIREAIELYLETDDTVPPDESRLSKM